MTLIAGAKPQGDFAINEDFQGIVENQQQKEGLQNLLNNIFGGTKNKGLPGGNIPAPPDATHVLGDFTRTDNNVETRSGSDNPGLTIQQIRDLIKTPTKSGGLLIPIIAATLVGYTLLRLVRA